MNWHLIKASNKKVFVPPGAEYYGKLFSSSADQRYAEIGQNRFMVATSWDHYYQLLQQVFSINDVVYLSNGLDPEEEKEGNWYISDETVT